MKGDPSQNKPGVSLRLLSKVATALVITMGVLVLLGWGLNIRSLIELFPTPVAMNPVTALGFVACGVCLWRLGRQGDGVPQRAGHHWITVALGAAIALAGLLRLMDLLLMLNLRIDQWLFASKITGPGDYPPSEMAENTALNFFLCGLGLLLYDFETKRGFYPAHGCILVAAWISWLAIIGYTYHVLLFYRLGVGQPMSLDTAVGFALFCFGFLSAQPRRGVLTILTSRTSGGGMARRLLPMAVLLPWGLGAILLVCEQAGLLGREFAISIFAVTTILLFTILLWWNAKQLYRVDLERQAAEDQLKQTSADLQRSNTELQQFAYIASHDLFEPLRMIISYLQLLEQRYQSKLDQQGREFINFAVDGAKRMEALIRDLLEYSRVDVRGHTLVSISAEEAFEAAVSNLKVAIKESGAKITHKPLPKIQADRLQLTQVFQNLIGNALKFHGSHTPQVDISAERREHDWLFAVRDNGIGIDPKNFARIFVIFQRLHTRLEYKGTGMGLAICKRIIERHGGNIWVESKQGQGSTFYFTLPAGT